MKNPVTLCIGRARITVPGPATVLYAEQEIDGVQLSWVKLDPGQTQDTGWNARVQEVAHDTGFQEGHLSLLRRMTILGRPALLRKMYDTADSNNEIQMWMPLGRRIVEARAEGSPTETAIMQQVLERVVPAVQAGPSERMMPQDFCIDGAVVRLPPQDGEAIGATIGLGGRAFTLDFDTEVQVKDKPPTLLTRWDREVLPFLKANHADYTSLRRRKLTWNQSLAEEIVEVDVHQEPGKSPVTSQTAQLDSSGIGRDAYHPFVTLHLSTDPYSPHLTEPNLLGLWDEIIASVTFDRAEGTGDGKR